MPRPTDILDNEFTPGSTVVYPYRHGSYMVMRTGTIESVTCGCGATFTDSMYSIGHDGPEQPSLAVRNPQGKLVRLTRLDNVVVVG